MEFIKVKTSLSHKYQHKGVKKPRGLGKIQHSILMTILYIDYINNSNSETRGQRAKIFKWEKDLNKHFTEVAIRMVNKIMKKRSTSLVNN